MTRYTVTLDDAQLELLALAVTYARAEVEAGTAALHSEHRALVEARAGDTLGALKMTRKAVRTPKPKPRPVVDAEPIAVSDPALAAFMRRSRERGAPSGPYPIASVPAFPRKVGGPATLKLTAKARVQHEIAWADAVQRAVEEPGQWTRGLAWAMPYNFTSRGLDQ